MNKKIKKQEVSVNSAESYEIKRFVKVLAIVLVCVLGIYLFTRAFVTKDLFDKKTSEEETSEPINISYDVTTLGSLFTRPYKEYYVIVYDSKDKLSTDYYSALMNKYKEAEDTIKIYSANLDTPFNQSFLSETSTPNATSVADLKVKGVTLIKISDGKITKFLEDKESITAELNTDKK